MIFNKQVDKPDKFKCFAVLGHVKCNKQFITVLFTRRSLMLPPSSRESSELRRLDKYLLPVVRVARAKGSANISNCLSAFSSCSFCCRSSSRMRISLASARACRLANNRASA